MIKKIIICILLLLIFQINTYAMEEDFILEEVYFPETNETYMIEKTDQFHSFKEPVIAVALGGGGARGFVNVGVLKALEEEKIPVDIITGTSMGAVVAVLYGSGLPINQIEEIVTSDILQKVIDINFPFNESLLTSRKLNYILQEITPVDRLELFPVPTALVSMDLTKEARLVQTQGEVNKVIQGSYAIPLVFPVVEYNTSYLIDPGMMGLTPACTAKLLGADIIISVTAYDELPYSTYKTPLRAWMKMINIIKENNSQRIVDRYSDVILAHDVGDYSYMDFTLAQKFIDMGYKLTKQKIPEIKEILVAKNVFTKKYNRNYNDNSHKIEMLINDVENDRVLYNFTDIKPVFTYGKDNTFFNQGYFRNNLNKSQYGLDVEHGNKEIMFMSENGRDRYEIKGSIKKITPQWDFEVLYSKNKGKQLYDFLLLDYRDNFTTCTGMTMMEDNYYLHFENDYDLELNTVDLKGRINILHALDSKTVNESIIENELIFPVHSGWDLHLKSVIANVDKLTVPDIYRDSLAADLPPLQASIELRKKHQFMYSHEIVDLLQMSGLEFYQYVDYIDSPAKSSYALGTGLEMDLNILGIKPLKFGGYLSYDFDSKSYQTGLVIDVSL